VCDDVFERLVYEPGLRSAPSFLRHYEEGDRIISVNSFSKAWSMTGWRAGWMVVPQVLTADLTKVIEYNFSCMFEPVQRATVVALQQGEPEITRLRGMLTRTRAQESLTALPGVEAPDAGGAMYVFFRIAGHDDSLALAKQLVSEVGLGLAPGSAFGPERNGWLRCATQLAPKPSARRRLPTQQFPVSQQSLNVCEGRLGRRRLVRESAREALRSGHRRCPRQGGSSYRRRSRPCGRT
jgi:aspartate/methionine/tyrosine aminotransferase